MLNIICWHTILTDHQSYTLRALADMPHINLKVNTLKSEDKIRKKQGWTISEFAALNTSTIQDNFLFRIYGIIRNQRDTIHIFGSPFESVEFIYALFIALFLKRRVYILSESYSPTAHGYLKDGFTPFSYFKSRIRPYIYKIYGLFIKNRIQGVFAISILSIHQYQQMGVARKKIFPFGYFVPKLENKVIEVNNDELESSSNLKIIFVGNLIATKGLDILVEAISESKGVALDVYGAGEWKFSEAGFNNVRYCGRIPFGYAEKIIASYDLLVLPSRYDGWGVVINEAIMAGVPVLCSDMVGAKTLVEKFNVGKVFAANNVLSIKKCINEVLDNPLLLKTWAENTPSCCIAIQPSAAAEYMLAVINHPGEKNPYAFSSPWYVMNERNS